MQDEKARFVEADLTQNKSTAIQVDISFCINALTHSVAKKKKRIADFDAVATKHYLHDEFAQLLEKVGFQVESVDRVEFPWAEVLDNAPEKLGKPYPWDWMVTASR